MDNDTDRKVAKILGAQGTVLYHDAYAPAMQYPAYSTDPALIGEMLEWLTREGYYWALYDDGVFEYGEKGDGDARTEPTLRQKESLNLAVCAAVIAVGVGGE